MTKTDRRGSVAIVAGISATVLTGFVALAVDVSVWQMQAAVLQGVADSASLAGAIALNTSTAAARAEAANVIAAHGLNNGVGGVTVTVNIPPVSGAYAGASGTVEVLVKQLQTRYFSGVVDAIAPTPQARAVSGSGGAGPACIQALGSTGATINVNNGPVDASTCSLASDSTDSCSVTAIVFFKVYVKNATYAGSPCQTTGGVIPSGVTRTFATPPADPFGTRVIPPANGACITPTIPPSPPTTLSPGTYCSIDVQGDAHVTLKPGVYVITNGGITVGNQASLTGSGVSLVFNNKTGNAYNAFDTSASPTITLSAPVAVPPDATCTANPNVCGIAVWIAGNGNLANGFGTGVPHQRAVGTLRHGHHQRRVLRPGRGYPVGASDGNLQRARGQDDHLHRHYHVRDQRLRQLRPIEGRRHHLVGREDARVATEESSSREGHGPSRSRHAVSRAARRAAPGPGPHARHRPWDVGRSVP